MSGVCVILGGGPGGGAVAAADEDGSAGGIFSPGFRPSVTRLSRLGDTPDS